MDIKNSIKKFNESDDFIIGTIRDLISIVPIIVIYILISNILFGLWTPMIAVESGSMKPHIQIGDIIFIKSIDRTQVITYRQGEKIGYSTFGDYGNVILYQPFGKKDITPIIHRARYYVKKGEPMWKGGPPAPHSGYITKGDNPVTNRLYDQEGSISYHQPVKKEWIIGVATPYRLPLLGYISLIPRDIIQSLL